MEGLIDGSPPGVKRGRTYDSTRRREQARQSRRRVIDAAERMFLADGYSSTTVQAIAAAAGVSADTIYKSFGGQAGTGPRDPRSRP